MDHYKHMTMVIDGVECRLAATTNEVGTRDTIVDALVRHNVFEHVHVYDNPEPTIKIRKYMVFVGGKQYEDNNKSVEVFGREVHDRTRQHL